MHGAKVCFNEEVVGWTQVGDQVEVVTTKRICRADKLILACGASVAKLIPELKVFGLSELRRILLQTWNV